jgi:hypothetical protein
MSKKFLTLTAAACLFAGALPAIAQEQDAPAPADKNSAFCSFTYFSNNADNLDFRGGDAQRCFDMKGGDDILILNREQFPAGVRVFTGTGRDTTWTTDADDYVYDLDGMDKEIRTYDGNDIVDIETELDRDPFRGIESSDRTIVKMGSGRNTLTFGRKVTVNSIARTSPDIWLTTGDEATDLVQATCGHPTISADYDLRSLEIPETSSVKYEMDGCHLGIFGLYGDADVNMSGGRLALQTYNEGFRVAAGENLPRITGHVEGGMSLMLDIDKSSPESNFTWEGPGSVFIRSRIKDAASGGSFHVQSGREIHYQGDMASGDVHFDLAARGVVKVDLVARGQSGLNRFSLAASRMDVSWRLAGQGGFPVIVNDVPVTYQETSFILPEFDWKAVKTVQTRSAQTTSPDRVINNKIPEAATDYEKVSEEVVIEPGNTRLRLQLRRDNDRFGKCVSMSLIDLDGTSPELSVICTSLSDAINSQVIEDATEYEQISITGDGVDIEIPINDASHFKVNRIEVDL